MRQEIRVVYSFTGNMAEKRPVLERMGCFISPGKTAGFFAISLLLLIYDSILT
jgi:hypothetical protein